MRSTSARNRRPASGRPASKVRLAFRLVAVELAEQQVGVGHLEVVGGELALVLQEHIAIGEHRAVVAACPYQVVHGVDALDVHGQALKAVGDSPTGTGRHSKPPTCWK